MRSATCWSKASFRAWRSTKSRRSRRSGFQEFGLPFAPDPAITRYLAAFLTAHRHVAMDERRAPPDHDPARPTSCYSTAASLNRPCSAIASWKCCKAGSTNCRKNIDDSKTDSRGPTARGAADANPAVRRPIVLDNDRLDLAVARGAAYSAWSGADKECGSPPVWLERITSE